MKKIILRLLVALVVLMILAVVGVAFFLDGAIKKGVETVGPQIAKVDVKLDGVSLSLLTGSGKIKGLVVGNPEGYKTPHAISVGSASLAISPGSVFSDKVVIKSIRVEAPEVIYELGAGGNNLKRIQANVESFTGPADPNAPASDKASKKLQVDEFIITGGKVSLSASMLGGQSITGPLPDIHLTQLGTGPDGITAADLTKRIMTEIAEASLKVAEKLVAQVGKEALNAAGVTGKAATDSVNKATKSVTDLFKKKSE